jgi:ribosomal protein S25
MPKKKEGSAKPTKSAGHKKWGGDDQEKEEHFQRDIYLDQEVMKNISEEISKTKMISPSMIAQKFNVRMSVVKHILKELSEQDKIKLAVSSNKLKIFVQN